MVVAFLFAFQKSMYNVPKKFVLSEVFRVFGVCETFGQHLHLVVQNGTTCEENRVKYAVK